MTFKNIPPEWENQGENPTEELRTKGFLPNYKPAAKTFNWFFSLVGRCLAELQQIITDRTRVIVSSEDAARTENNALYLIVADSAADINAVAYDNAAMAASEPATGDNWLKVNTAAKISDSGRFVVQNGKLAVLKEPQGDETFLSK